jgi:hypothetical protein
MSAFVHAARLYFYQVSCGLMRHFLNTFQVYVSALKALVGATENNKFARM